MPTRTVLMLGSGASRGSEFELPTMDGFFVGGAALPGNLDDFLAWFYPNRPRDAYNLEEVLAYLDISRTRLPLWGLRDPIIHRFDKEELYTSLLEYVKTRLDIPPGAICPVHEQLIESLDDRDSILSLNYDLVVDRILRRQEVIADYPGHPGFGRLGKLAGLVGYWMQSIYPGPTLHRQEREKGFYLKLHGSLDWFYCLTPGCQNNTSIYPAGVWEATARFDRTPCRNCGAALVTYIVPPVATKRLEDRSRMAFIWHLALQELAAADKIAIIGLSFAATDFELRWLLRQAIALSRNGAPVLHLVNPNEGHRRAVVEMLPEPIRQIEHFESLEDYLRGQRAQ
jgi:hypothetical protein